MIARKVQRDLLLQLSNFLSFFIFFISFDLFAQELKASKSFSQKHRDVEEMLTGSFYEQLYKRSYKLSPTLKQRNQPKSVNQGKRGKLIIEEMKQRNREKLAIMRGVDPSKVKKGSDLVKLQQEDNKEIAKKISQMSKEENWNKLAQNEIEELKKKVMIEHRAWRKKHLPTLKEWEKQREKYLGQVDEYKKTLADIPLVLPISKEEQDKEVGIEIEKEYQIVANSLASLVRDQSSRATCAAFAAIRAIEIMLQQNDKKYDLSEQYFYWASKPDCQNTPCEIKGSWLGYGLDHSRKKSTPDIPQENNCRYNPMFQAGNETHVPLEKSCNEGKVKVEKYTLHKTLDEVVEQLDKNKAVTAGIKLTPNFYKNQGIIFESEKDQGGKLDAHAAGHTVLIIGYLKLPIAFNEGKVCFIIANSWGAGWGSGGHACISEKWMLNHRSRNPFVSIDSIKI